MKKLQLSITLLFSTSIAVASFQEKISEPENRKGKIYEKLTYVNMEVLQEREIREESKDLSSIANQIFKDPSKIHELELPEGMTIHVDRLNESPTESNYGGQITFKSDSTETTIIGGKYIGLKKVSHY